MKIDFKKYLPLYISVGVAAVILLFSLFFYSKKAYGKKYLFVFPCVDEGKYVLETRYLKDNPEIDRPRKKTLDKKIDILLPSLFLALVLKEQCIFLRREQKSFPVLKGIK